MQEKTQNCCLMMTSLDEDTGKVILTYVPLNLDISVVDFFIKNGTCTNNYAIEFELNQTEQDFWKGMWSDLEATVNM